MNSDDQMEEKWEHPEGALISSWGAAQVSIPLWALVHLPVVVTVTTAVFTPKACLFLTSLISVALTCILPILSESEQNKLNTWALLLDGRDPFSLDKTPLPQQHGCAMADHQKSNMVLMLQGWVHSILYVLFENAMGVVKLWAVVAGIVLSSSWNFTPHSDFAGLHCLWAFARNVLRKSTRFLGIQLM